MSATRDPSQKHTFVYSNLYQLYQKGKVAAQAAKIPSPEPAPVPLHESSRAGLATGKVIKADETIGLRVRSHEPPRLLGKRLEVNRATLSPSVATSRRQAIQGLRDNLRQLQGLHERLRFMLKEIEEFSNE